MPLVCGVVRRPVIVPAFQPLSTAGTEDEVELWITNDRHEAAEATVVIELHSFDGAVIGSETLTATVAPAAPTCWPSDRSRRLLSRRRIAACVSSNWR
jgi:hypothetical protein